jgi:nucleoside phosphorylase
MRSYDIVLVVPLAEEFDSIKRLFDVDRSFVRNRITFYELSVTNPDLAPPDLDIVAVVLSQMGNANAAQKTERVLSMIDPPGPDLVALVGIAGRLDDDLGLSDVVIGTEVTNYEIRSKLAEDSSEKPDEEETQGSDTDSSDDEQEAVEEHTVVDTETPLSFVDWKPGGRTYSVASEVFEAVARFRNETTEYRTWQEETTEQVLSWVPEKNLPPALGTADQDEDGQLTDDQFDTPIQAVNEPLASGSFVITSEEFTEILAEQNRNFAAVEMEAAGVLLAVQRTTGVNGIVIRGISDLADDGKGNLDNMGSEGGLWRRCATYAAANYFVHFLTVGSVSEAASPVDRPVRHQEQSIISDDSTPVDITELSAGDFQTETTGPSHSFFRRYVNSSGPTIKSDPERDGVGIHIEFDIKVPEPLQLSSVSLDPGFNSNIQDTDQQLIVNGVKRGLTKESQEYLERPTKLEPDDSNTIRILTNSILRDPSGFDVEPNNSVALEVTCEFESPASEDTICYILGGYLGATRGLVWTESQII